MKVAFFIGREHHSVKLLPIATAGQEKEAFDPIYILADNSINIDPASEFVIKYPPLGAGTLVHLKMFEKTGSQNDKATQSLLRRVFKSGASATVSPFWLAHSVREAVRSMGAFKAFLIEHNPDAVFVLHGQNFWTKQLVYLASESGIPTYSLQEGIILSREERDLKKYTYASEYMTNVFTWSEHDRQFYGNADVVVPVGVPHLDYWTKFRDTPRDRMILRHKMLSSLGMKSAKPTVMFAPPRLDLYKGDPIDDLREVCKWAVRNGVNVVIKPHPFEGDLSDLIRISKIFPNGKLYTNIDPLAALLSVDAVVSQTSTISLESIAMGTPVIEMDRNHIGLDEPLNKIGAATLIDSDDMSPIGRVLAGDFDIEGANNFIVNRLSLVDGHASERIVDKITNE